MRCISSCQRRVRSKHNARNHRVAQFTRATLPVTQGHQITSVLRCCQIKGNNATLQLLNKDSFKRLNQYRTPLSSGQNLKSVANLEYCDRARPNGGASLLVEPFDHLMVRRMTHHLRQYIRIKYDHRAKDAGLTL